MNQTERKFHLILLLQKERKRSCINPFFTPLSSNYFKSSQNHALGGLYSFSTIFLYSARALKNIVQTYKSNQKDICSWIKRRMIHMHIILPSWLLQSCAAWLFRGELMFGSEITQHKEKQSIKKLTSKRSQKALSQLIPGRKIYTSKQRLDR